MAAHRIAVDRIAVDMIVVDRIALDRIAGDTAAGDILGMMVVGRHSDCASADASSSGGESILGPWPFAADRSDSRMGRATAPARFGEEGTMKGWRPKSTERLPNAAPG